MTHLGYGNLECLTCVAWLEGLEGGVDGLHAYFPHFVVVVEVTVSEGATVVAGEEDFVGVRVVYRPLVRECKGRIGSNLVKRWVGPEDG